MTVQAKGQVKMGRGHHKIYLSGQTKQGNSGTPTMRGVGYNPSTAVPATPSTAVPATPSTAVPATQLTCRQPRMTGIIHSGSVACVLSSISTERNCILARRGSPAPTHVQQITSAACKHTCKPNALRNKGTCTYNRINNCEVRIYAWEHVQFWQKNKQELVDHTLIRSNSFIWVTATVPLKDLEYHSSTPLRSAPHTKGP